MRRLFPLAVLVLILLCPPPLRGQDRGPRREAFTDPARTFPMPPEWANKPIKYEAWAGQADLAVTLEQDVYYMVLPLIARFEGERGVKVAVQEGTCGISAGALSKKTVDIGGFCCPPGYDDRLPGLRFHTLGIVAKAVLVNPQNPVDGLTMAQVRDIFSGRVRNWSGIKPKGGVPALSLPVHPIGRFHCPLRPGHWRLILDGEDRFGTGTFTVGAIPDMIALVARDRAAIGWEVLGMVDKYKDKGKVKPIKVDGSAPSDAGALASFKYPIYRTYNITTWEGAGVENPLAMELVDYLLKESEKLDLSKFGFAPASSLRRAGWKFKGNELVGEPR